MIADVKKNTEQKMSKSLEALKADFAKVRTGRAHTGILDHVISRVSGQPYADFMRERVFPMGPFEVADAAGELVGGLFYYNYPGSSGLMAGSVFGRIAGREAAAHARGVQAPAASVPRVHQSRRPSLPRHRQPGQQPLALHVPGDAALPGGAPRRAGPRGQRPRR